MKKIKIWHIYDLNGTKDADYTNKDGYTDFEVNFGTSEEGFSASEVRDLLVSMNVQEGLLKLFDDNRNNLCNPKKVFDCSTDNETVYISQEFLDYYE